MKAVRACSRPPRIHLFVQHRSTLKVQQIRAQGPRMDQYLCYLNVFMCELNDAALLLNLSGSSSIRACSSFQSVLYEWNAREDILLSVKGIFLSYYIYLLLKSFLWSWLLSVDRSGWSISSDHRTFPKPRRRWRRLFFPPVDEHWQGLEWSYRGFFLTLCLF